MTVTNNHKRTTMKRVSVFLIFNFIVLFNQVHGQTFKVQFNALVAKSDTLGQKQLLEKWEVIDKNDPELFIAYFNYYVIKSKSEIVRLGQDPMDKNGLEILDQDTTNKVPLGFINGDAYYNTKLLSKGLIWINKGIEKYPNRLDMRFGEIYMFGQMEDYESFTKKIIKTIDYSDIIKNKWTWADSKPLDNPKDFMLSAIQTYQLQLYDIDNDALLNNMKYIAESVLTYYPDHVESLSNLAIVYILQKQYDKALESLLSAEKLKPSDYIVLGNIAETYKLMGDNKNALKYYKLTLKNGDDQAKEFAKTQIKELEKK